MRAAVASHWLPACRAQPRRRNRVIRPMPGLLDDRRGFDIHPLTMTADDNSIGFVMPSPRPGRHRSYARASINAHEPAQACQANGCRRRGRGSSRIGLSMTKQASEMGGRPGHQFEAFRLLMMRESSTSRRHGRMNRRRCAAGESLAGQRPGGAAGCAADVSKTSSAGPGASRSTKRVCRRAAFDFRHIVRMLPRLSTRAPWCAACR